MSDAQLKEKVVEAAVVRELLQRKFRDRSAAHWSGAESISQEIAELGEAISAAAARYQAAVDALIEARMASMK